MTATTKIGETRSERAQRVFGARTPPLRVCASYKYLWRSYEAQRASAVGNVDGDGEDDTRRTCLA